MTDFIIKIFQSAQEDVHELFLQQCTYDLVLLCGLYIAFASFKRKVLILVIIG